MLGRHGIGKNKAGMKIGPGKKEKNPMQQRKRKEREERKKVKEVEQRWEG